MSKLIIIYSSNIYNGGSYCGNFEPDKAGS